MRNFSIKLLAVIFVFGTVSHTMGQDFAPRTAIQPPSRNSSPQSGSFGNQIGESSQDDDRPRTGVMGEVTEEHVDINNAFAQLIEDVEVPAEETGKLIEIVVKRGDTVDVKSTLAKIDSSRTQRMLEEAKLKFDQASRRAVDNTAINGANKKLQLATEEFNDTERLFRKGSKSKTEYKRAAYSMQIAQLELQAAKNEKQLAMVESQTQNVAVNAANDSLARHQLRSTLNGEVFEVLKDKGEWVQAGETVLRIARMDKLRIQGSVDSTVFNPPEIDGRRVTAKVQLAGDQIEEFTGKVTYVSSENYGDTFQIDVEIDNRKYPGNDKHWILRAGADLKVRIHFDGAPIARRNVNRR
jgi:macrolide-specific efflux system membrane fusion protein